MAGVRSVEGRGGKMSSNIIALCLPIIAGPINKQTTSLTSLTRVLLLGGVCGLLAEAVVTWPPADHHRNLGQLRARKDGPAGRQRRRWRGSSVAAASVFQVV